MCEHPNGPHFVTAVFMTKAVTEFIDEITKELGEEGLHHIMFLSGTRRATVCGSHTEALAAVSRELERTDRTGNKPTMVDIINATSFELCARITNG